MTCPSHFYVLRFFSEVRFLLNAKVISFNMWVSLNVVVGVVKRRRRFVAQRGFLRMNCYFGSSAMTFSSLNICPDDFSPPDPFLLKSSSDIWLCGRIAALDSRVLGSMQ